MADSKTTTKAKAASKPKDAPEAGVSREEFTELGNKVNTAVSAVEGLVDLIKSGKLGAPAQTPAEVAATKEVDKAGANRYIVNPEWEEIAREIIGEALDHTEVEYVKGGGMKFTAVIKEDFSNAPADYLERYKVDRRSKEVGQEGEAGVRVWCELIRNNLKRERPIVN